MPSEARVKAEGGGEGRMRQGQGHDTIDRARPRPGSDQERPKPGRCQGRGGKDHAGPGRTEWVGGGMKRTQEDQSRDGKESGAGVAGQVGERREAPAVPLRSWPCPRRAEPRAREPQRQGLPPSPPGMLKASASAAPQRPRQGAGPPLTSGALRHAFPLARGLALCGSHVGCGAANKALLRPVVSLRAPPKGSRLLSKLIS